MNTTEDATHEITSKPSQTRLRRFSPYLFSVLLFLFVLMRGVNLGGTLAPFEGGDEYNYIAVAYYLDTRGKMPAIDEPLPTDKILLDYFLKYPHPQFSAQHLVGLSVRDYEGRVFDPKTKEWLQSTPDTPPGKPTWALYQAQQGRFYFQVLVWLKKIGGFTDLARWFDAARLLNIVLSSITVVLWFFIFRICFASGRWSGITYLASLVFAVNSHYMYTVARVANSALPIFFGSIAILLYMIGFRRRERTFRQLVILTIIMGISCGLGVLARVTVITVPVVLFLIISVRAWQNRDAWRYRGIFLPGILFAAYLLVTGMMHYQAYQETGSVTNNLLSKLLRDKGQGAGDILASIGGLSANEVGHFLLYN